MSFDIASAFELLLDDSPLPHASKLTRARVAPYIHFFEHDFIEEDISEEHLNWEDKLYAL